MMEAGRPCPAVALVAAFDRRRVIGADGGIPWRLPDDMRFFKQVTLGKPLVMGRKTFESIGRPLPGRRNIILTRQEDYRPEGCIVVHGVEAALAAAEGAAEIMIAGGADIYRLFLPRAYRLFLTHVDASVEGDTYFPEYDESGWRPILRQPHAIDERHAYSFEIVMYERRPLSP